MTNIFLYVLFFTIPLIHSSFLNYFWFDFNSLVNWNFEFTKVIFFNIIASLSIISYIIEYFSKNEKIKIYYSNLLLFIAWISILSTLFSISPFISLFWNQEKSHSLILILNLIWTFIVLINRKKNVLENILKIFLLSMFFVVIIWIKEYYIPSLYYQENLNKAVSSFWNNQYLALSIVFLLPILLKKYKLKYNFLYLILPFLCLILTKSLIWITIFLIYILIYIFGKNKWFLLSILLLFIWTISIFIYFPEKLHSFLSRFYIWQNVLSLYSSSFKNILFWYWFETLDLIFPKEKNPYLYIFENYWFIADRSHNLWLDILYSTWLLWFSLAVYTSFLILKLSKNTYYYDVFIIFFVFCFFNFASVTNYLFLLLIFSLFLKKKWSDIELNKLNNSYILFIPIIFCLFSIFYGIKFYLAEYYYKLDNITKSIETFNYPKYNFQVWKYEEWLEFYSFPPMYYYQNKIILGDNNKLIVNCNNIVENYNIAENYIWCWNLLERANYKKESHIFYKKWLSLLPDLWNKNSNYYNNFFVKYTITKNRFLSEKYGNLWKIINLEN